MPRATPNQGSLGSVESAQIGPHVVITTFVGHIARSAADAQLMQFRERLAKMSEPTWIMDCSSITGFDPSAVGAGAKWFDAFKVRGGSRVLLVSRLHAARMAAATIAFGVGLRVQTFDELRDALDHLGLRPTSAR
jgi:hypothetical protein